MDHLESAESTETLHDRVGETADERLRTANMIGLLEIVVQIHGEQFKRDADVVAKLKVRFHLNEIETVTLVRGFQISQYVDLGARLGVELGLVADHL